MKNVILPALFVAALSVMGLACGEADRTIDCAQICEKYHTCFDDDIDKLDCVDSCEDEADRDADFEERVDDCENCLDSTSCSEATVECAGECGSIMAEST